MKTLKIQKLLLKLVVFLFNFFKDVVINIYALLGALVEPPIKFLFKNKKKVKKISWKIWFALTVFFISIIASWFLFLIWLSEIFPIQTFRIILVVVIALGIFVFSIIYKGDKKTYEMEKEEGKKKKNGTTLLFIGIIVGVFSFQEIFAQTEEQDSWSLNNIVISSGKTPLTEGLNSIIGFSKQKHSLSIFLNNEYSNIHYGYQVKGWLVIGSTLEMFKNVPGTGIMINLSFFEGRIITTNWAGISYGNPETRKTDFGAPAFLFSYQEIKYVSKYFDLVYLLQHYQRNMASHVPGVTLKCPLSVGGKERKFFLNMNYLLGRKGDSGGEGFMWGIGVVL